MFSRFPALRVAGLVLLAGVALPVFAQTDPTRPSYSRMLNIDALVEAQARTLARRYNLSEDQDLYTQALLRDKVNAFLDKHRDELFDLIDRLVEVRAGGDMSQQDLVAWGKQALPLYEEAKTFIIHGNDEWRQILTEEQRRTHDLDLQEMYDSFGTTEDQLQRIVSGQMTLDDFRRGPARQVPRTAQPLRPAAPVLPQEGASPGHTPQPAAVPASGARPTVPDVGGAPAAKSTPRSTGAGASSSRSSVPGRGRSGAASQPARGSADFESQWETYVREFIQKYQLDEGQTQRAESVLKECQESAQRIIQKNKSEIEQLDKRLQALGDSKDPDKLKELNEVGARRTKLLEPISEIFEKQLKPRLEKLPTRAQRQAAEDASKRPPAGQPAPGKPGRPGPQPPRPQPEPKPQPEPEPPPQPEPPPPEQDTGP